MMNHRLYAFVAILIISSCKEKVDVPVNVLGAFTAKYSAASEVEWEAEDDEYEVEFELGDLEMTATFSKDGSWMETEWEIEKNELSANLVSAINQKYAGYEIKKVEMIEMPDMKGYEISIEKGEEEIEVIFDMNGTFIKEKAKEDEHDEDEDDND